MPPVSAAPWTSSPSQHKVKSPTRRITCKVSVGPRDGGGFGIAVKMKVKSPTLPTGELRGIVEEAHEKVCPYSHATRGNIPFELEVFGA